MTAKQLADALEPYLQAAGLRIHRYPCKAVEHHQIEGIYRAHLPPDYKELAPCTCGFDALIQKAKEEAS